MPAEQPRLVWVEHLHSFLAIIFDLVFISENVYPSNNIRGLPRFDLMYVKRFVGIGSETIYIVVINEIIDCNYYLYFVLALYLLSSSSLDGYMCK